MLCSMAKNFKKSEDFKWAEWNLGLHMQYSYRGILESGVKVQTTPTGRSALEGNKRDTSNAPGQGDI